MVRFDILTLFPEMFAGPFEASIIKRAQENLFIEIALHNIRDYAPGKHRVTDDTPYGGGGGMIMKPEPIFNAVEAILGIDVPLSGYEELHRQGYPPIILLTPQGQLLTQPAAQALTTVERLLLICGRYEGIDERVRRYLVTDELSIGDYVLSGGEIAAMIVVDAVTRLIPGVLGDTEATAKDSHSEGLLEYPHYTRPAEFRGHAVPDILLSGHHAKLEEWRRRQSLLRTQARRPDLLALAQLSEADRDFLAQQEHRNGNNEDGEASSTE
ncbi:MAG TPA: tRNA (guanosine(37)-N1)-methyltransferase TrmD [Anaerolineae bacterium]|nr:tRNA (guanosine(37)-N1)-methyltransferase TrmD [Anaerolineae bacterium]MCB9105300.1 tRNA (guanosine(37)-N1)-methyltransferase TrmD [Anaerolineales bacterium]HRV92654.1 tRNA (guanosine(37)-N1)-methyltransferase TrmD [Anaerolineae bacterium]